MYYRLKVVPIDVPPLRERREDIPILIDHYARLFAAEMHQETPGITPAAMKLLITYDWPGNVRELANVVERSVIMSGGVIDVGDLPGLVPVSKQALEVPLTGTLKEILQSVEKVVISRALKQHNGNKVKTAQALDMSRRALIYKMQDYGLADANETVVGE